MVVKSTYRPVMPSEAFIMWRHLGDNTNSGLSETKMYKAKASTEGNFTWLDDLMRWRFTKVSFSAWDKVMRKAHFGCVSTVDGLKWLLGSREHCLLTLQCRLSDSVFPFEAVIFRNIWFCASLSPSDTLLKGSTTLWRCYSFKNGTTSIQHC